MSRRPLTESQRAFLARWARDYAREYDQPWRAYYDPERPRGKLEDDALECLAECYPRLILEGVYSHEYGVYETDYRDDTVDVICAAIAAVPGRWEGGKLAARRRWRWPARPRLWGRALAMRVHPGRWAGGGGIL